MIYTTVDNSHLVVNSQLPFISRSIQQCVTGQGAIDIKLYMVSTK